MAVEEVVAQNLHKECLCLLELLLMSSSPLHKQMPEKVETLTSISHKEKKTMKKEFTTLKGVLKLVTYHYQISVTTVTHPIHVQPPIVKDHLP